MPSSRPLIRPGHQIQLIEVYLLSHYRKGIGLHVKEYSRNSLLRTLYPHRATTELRCWEPARTGSAGILALAEMWRELVNNLNRMGASGTPAISPCSSVRRTSRILETVLPRPLRLRFEFCFEPRCPRTNKGATAPLARLKKDAALDPNLCLQAHMTP